MKSSFGASNGNPREDITRLMGSRLVVTSELGENERFDEPLLKGLTGSESLVGRVPYAKKSIEFSPTFKVWIAGNHQPYIYGTDEGIWRRVVIVPFNQDFTGREDKDLEDQLVKELPGVLNWAIEGCIKWQKEGLQIPGSVLKYTNENRSEMDILQSFIDDRCDATDVSAKSTMAELYQAYKNWGHLNGISRPLSDRAFGKKLKEKGYVPIKSNGVRYRKGICLKPPSVFTPHFVAAS